MLDARSSFWLPRNRNYYLVPLTLVWKESKLDLSGSEDAFAIAKPRLEPVVEQGRYLADGEVLDTSTELQTVQRALHWLSVGRNEPVASEALLAHWLAYETLLGSRSYEMSSRARMHRLLGDYARRLRR